MKPIFLKIFSSIIFFIVIFPFVSTFSTTRAASQFSVSLDYSFTFQDNGIANVSQKVTSKNLTKEYYTQKYSTTIHNKNVTNVSGSDGSGSIAVTSKVDNESTIITAVLKQEVVGLNESVTFTINYSTDSFAIKRGKIWDVSIPQIETSESVASYQVTISVPNSFGKLVKITPNSVSQSEIGGHKSYVFTKNSLNNSRIGASFGDYQQFKFTLKYRYKNAKVYAVKATIALPPDTQYQALYYKNIDPRPVELRTDFDGNYLADYIIKPGKKLEVIASGDVKIIDSDTPLQKPKAWTETDLEKFTKSDKYIEVDNRQIQKQAKELKNIDEIYNFVVSTVKYDFTRLETNKYNRRGALATINQPDKSICVDFADLFVALARAKGIPARGLVGYGYSDDTSKRPTKIEGLVNSTVLHAWAEYYDKSQKRWIQVDPTWGSTTGGVDYFNRIDTNHFVFVINGVSSTLPIPAGGYKTSVNQTDDVSVKFSDEKLFESAIPDISLSLEQIVSGFPATSKLKITNNYGRAFFNAVIEIESSKTLKLIKPNKVTIGILLPFASNSYDIKLRSDSLLDNQVENLKLKFSAVGDKGEIEKRLAKELKIKPFFSFQIPQIMLLIFLIITLASWVHHFQVKRKLKA